MFYAWVKIIHIISAALLFGTGLGTAFYMFYVNLQKNIQLVARATAAVVVADAWFTTSSGIIQAITGFTMIYLKGYSVSSFWILGSIVGYIFAGICWLPVVWLQIQCRDLAMTAFINNSELPHQYHRYFKIWWMLGIPAFFSLIIVFYLMANKPLSMLTMI